MKLSNFVLESSEGDRAHNKRYFAAVDVETGFFPFRKKERVKIAREYAGYWFFVETGQYTPLGQAESLARSWQAKTGQEC